MLDTLSNLGYSVKLFSKVEELCKFVKDVSHQLDCLILVQDSALAALIHWLHGQAILLPAVIVQPEAIAPVAPEKGDRESEVMPLEAAPGQEATDTVSLSSSFTYHTAEVKVSATELPTLGQTIKRAIAQFINLSPTCWVKSASYSSATELLEILPASQQHQLIEKLKERLGYLGVYYKRDPKNFFRHLSSDAKQELIDKLKVDYREIVLCYFDSDETLNRRIDEFVNVVFFTDIAVAQIVEIHMDLMDEFAQQLKLEGRSEEILLDYRLTLIDTLAHLCEMYRRSIPRES